MIPRPIYTRQGHPKKAVEEALKYADSHGWRIEVSGSHAWGKIFCPANDPDCRCGDFSVSSNWSTPKNPANHAKPTRRVVNNCTFDRTSHRTFQLTTHRTSHRTFHRTTEPGANNERL